MLFYPRACGQRIEYFNNQLPNLQEHAVRVCTESRPLRVNDHSLLADRALSRTQAIDLMTASLGCDGVSCGNLALMEVTGGQQMGAVSTAPLIFWLVVVPHIITSIS